MFTRRDAIRGAAAAAAAAAGGAWPLVSAAQGAGSSELHAREVSVQLLPREYPATRVWSYSGGIAGPTLRLPQSGRLTRRLVNGLPEATTVHWHGIRIDNAMDGVAGLTQDPAAPGAAFDYDFAVPDAGTYWYHAHTRSYEQVARGLYGALIVEEPEPPEVDRDEVLLLDDWRVNPEDGQLDPSFGAMHDLSHAGRLGNVITTNGDFAHAIDVRHGERLRLRLVNAATARIFALGLKGIEGWVVAHDGMPLARPVPVPETLVLGPAQRVDLIVDVTAADGESAWLYHLERGEGFAQSGFRVSGTAATARRPAPAPLPPNPRMDVTGLAGARHLRLAMEGGAMGRMDAAILDGRRRSFREIASAGQFWALGGTVGMPDAPLAELARGETARIALVNDTAFPHAMHLHGLHFREVLADGALGPMRDTILVERGESREIAFVADNPGDWLFHCHMLAHAASGMTTWLRVA